MFDLWASIASVWWIYLGLLFRSFGNRFSWEGAYRQAVACFSRGLKYAPGNASLYFWRGTLYWRELGDFQQAEADLTKAIGLAPKMARAYLNRGFARWYASPPDREGAAEDLRAFLEHSQDAYWRAVAQEHLRQLGGEEKA